MKKNYETPSVEVVKFLYKDQVVAASGCDTIWINEKDSSGQCNKAPIEHRVEN